MNNSSSDRRPGFAARVGKLALIVGMAGFVIGAVEGLVVASVAGGSDLMLATRHGILFSVLGLISGAMSGAVDWLVKARKQA